MVSYPYHPTSYSHHSSHPFLDSKRLSVCMQRCAFIDSSAIKGRGERNELKWPVDRVHSPSLAASLPAHLERIEVHHPLIHPSLLQNPPRNKAIRGCSWVLTSHQRKKAGFDRIISFRGLRFSVHKTTPDNSPYA